jgi:hypothetical protein
VEAVVRRMDRASFFVCMRERERGGGESGGFVYNPRVVACVRVVAGGDGELGADLNAVPVAVHRGVSGVFPRGELQRPVL